MPAIVWFRVSHITGPPALVRTYREKCWCTGVDSNHRTPKGGQIYSLLALTAHPPVHVPILRGARLRCHRLRTKTRFQRSASSTLPAEASCGAARVKHATIAGIQDISRRPGRRIHRQVRVDCKNGYALLRQAARLKHAQKLISLANARVPGKQLGAGEGI